MYECTSVVTRDFLRLFLKIKLKKKISKTYIRVFTAFITLKNYDHWTLSKIKGEYLSRTKSHRDETALRKDMREHDKNQLYECCRKK